MSSELIRENAPSADELRVKDMTGEYLLTQKELGLFFNTTGEQARKLCAKHGVFPINIGLGKVPRLRWLASQVTTIPTILQASSSKPQKEFRKRRKGDVHILGRSVQSLYDELVCSQ